MEDPSSGKNLLAEEQERLLTFNNHQLVKSLNSAQLAKAGFYFIESEQIVKCFNCDLELKALDLISKEVNIMALHKEKKPGCLFAQKLTKSLNTENYKTFRSPLESLRFEKCRLDTFIDWPVSFISPADLAKDGFYFLKISDHCSCVYCKGVIGAWEKGDTPRGEHKKHFGQCPFLNGEAVGNIPMEECKILMKFNNKFIMPKVCSVVDGRCYGTSEDVTGLGRQAQTSGMISKNTVSQKMNDVTLEDIGLCEYKGPEHKPFISYDTRLESFRHWPDGCKVKPQDLAEAGFYNCGPGDHVRCFHCGYGICNWEKDDVPWDLHAYWYPKCNFVLLTKGLDFINKVRSREPVNTKDKKQQPVVAESDLDSLMKLDVIRSVLGRDFSEIAVRGALRKKLEETGLPFISFECCLDAVFTYADEETRLFLEETCKDEQNNTNLSETQVDQIPPLNTTTNNVSASSAQSISTSLPPLPSHSTPASISPLPSLRVHVPTMQLLPLPHPDLNNVAPSSFSSRVTSEVEKSGSSSEHEQDQVANNGHSSQTDCYARQSIFNGSNGLSSSDNSGLFSAAATLLSSDKLQQELDRVKDTMMCKVCMDAEMCIVFLPCAHMATCASCTINLSACPVCRQQIKYTIKPILS